MLTFQSFLLVCFIVYSVLMPPDSPAWSSVPPRRSWQIFKYHKVRQDYGAYENELKNKNTMPNKKIITYMSFYFEMNVTETNYTLRIQ